MSKSEDLLHIKLIDTAFDDLFFKNFTNEQIAEKYNCSVHTVSKCRSSEEYQDKCKKILEDIDRDLTQKFEKIKNNTLLYLDDFVRHIIKERDYNPQNVANIIRILERIEKRFSQKHEIDGNIKEDLTIQIITEKDEC